LQRIKQKVDPKIKIKNEDKIYFIVNSCFHFGIHCWERLSSAIFSIFWKHKGRNELRVKILSEGKPVKNLEVDVAKKPGPPPKGGVAITDENGIATFYLESEKYYVFFNAANFPKNLEYPVPKQIVVEEGKVNEYTINLTPK
jgi:hypothetical protein